MKRLTYIFAIVAMLLGMIGNVNAQQKWSFSSVSATDQANLNADTENWTYDSSNSRWTSKAIITDEVVGIETANSWDLLLDARRMLPKRQAYTLQAQSLPHIP